MAEKEVGKELVIKEFEGAEVVPQEEWDALIDDCKSILTESITNVRESIIRMKWELGDRMIQSGEERIRPHLLRIATELQISERDLYYCLAFRSKFPLLSDMWERVPDGKNISWHKLINNYIDFSVPKPVIPIEEKLDEWGLTKWWQKQDGLHCLRIKSQEDDFTLVVRVGRVRQEEQAKMREPYKDMYKEISDYFIAIKKWDTNDLDRSDYVRMHKTIKAMLEKAKYDKNKVKIAIKWCHDQFQGKEITWTIETCAKKFAEANRPRKFYEEHLKKGRR